jgi:hypothetical protein
MMLKILALRISTQLRESELKCKAEEKHNSKLSRTFYEATAYSSHAAPSPPLHIGTTIEMANRIGRCLELIRGLVEAISRVLKTAIICEGAALELVVSCKY